MAHYIEVVLQKRGVRCAARLLDEEAPRTCRAVWEGLPQEGEVFHAKYANNEIYILVPTFSDPEPGPENRTLVPIPGDLMYFHIPPGSALPRESQHLAEGGSAVIDLAVFYDRNNILFSPTEGPFPGNVFAVIVKNLDEMKEAGRSIWREGAVGERLIFRRLEGEGLKEWGLDGS